MEYECMERKIKVQKSHPKETFFPKTDAHTNTHKGSSVWAAKSTHLEDEWAAFHFSGSARCQSWIQFHPNHDLWLLDSRDPSREQFVPQCALALNTHSPLSLGLGNETNVPHQFHLFHPATSSGWKSTQTPQSQYKAPANYFPLKSTPCPPHSLGLKFIPSVEVSAYLDVSQ